MRFFAQESFIPLNTRASVYSATFIQITDFQRAPLNVRVSIRGTSNNINNKTQTKGVVLGEFYRDPGESNRISGACLVPTFAVYGASRRPIMRLSNSC